MKLFARVLEHARTRADHPALITGTAAEREVVSYARLLGGAFGIADLIRQEGGSGPVFLAAARNGGLVAGILGALWAGVPPAALDLKQPAARTRSVLGQVERPLVLVDAAGRRHLDAAAVAEAKTLPLPALGPAEPPGPGREPASLPTEPGVILFTSGSTGTPKGVVVSRGDLDQRLVTEESWFALTPEDRIFGVLPLTFDVGLTQLLGTLFAGGTHVLGESWLPRDILGRIEQDRLTGLALAPVVWRHLLAAKQQEEVWAALNRLRYVTLSGGSLPHAELELMQRGLTSARLVRTYGQTEMFRIAALDGARYPDKLGSVGLPYPGVTLEVRRPDGMQAAVRERGEVFAGGLGRMLGYWGDDHPRADAWSLHGTGDWGFLDEDGFLHLEGRQDDMIKILDRRIFPAEVAAFCRSVLGDTTLEVVAVQRSEPALVAFTTRRLSPTEVTEEVTRLRRDLGGMLAPQLLLTLEEMPATPTGKVDYVVLKQRAAEALGGGHWGGGDGRR